MGVEKIHLKDFRNFEEKVLTFSPSTTVIVGPNASGKTNILESLYLLSTGKSFRVRLEEEMVKEGSQLARVQGIVGSIEKTKLEVILTRGEIGGERVGRKKLMVNQLGKRLVDYAGIFKVVLFGPWDMDLISDSPSTRRKFMDGVLSQVDREYRRAILSYEKGLRQRNKLLERIRDEGVSRSQLLFWDKLIIRNGDYISLKRQEFVDFVNSTKPLNDNGYLVEYDKSAISEVRLAQYVNEEIAAATTLVGPHRDDLVFKVKEQGRDLSVFGSRGEQRMCILWVKLAELSFIEKVTGEKPTLLLDDIFSELDHNHRDIVMGITGIQQTVITTADPHFIEGFKKVEIINLNGVK